ncbi:MAG: hypothetical protein DRJ15_05060 [Bacteroidetes bacterium]|nr:MAG: hypothetical protein DRJ15_05060 [Bacteroidota bacterium]
MINNKALSLLLVLFLISSSAFSQFGQQGSSGKNDDFKMQKRLYIGGGLGFGISSYSTSLIVSPVVGYRLSPSFDVGSRFTYTYYRYNDSPLKYSTNNFGLAGFVRYYLFFFNDLFLHAEYEALNYEYAESIAPNGEIIKVRNWVSGLFVGGGYRQWIGQNAFVGISVLWNILDDINTPYSNPIFRIGVGVGI